MIFLAVAFGYFWFLDKGDNALSSFNPFPAIFPGFFHNQKTAAEIKKTTLPLPEISSENKSEKTDMAPPEVEAEKEKTIVKEVATKIDKTEKTVKIITNEPSKKKANIKKETGDTRYYIIVGGFGSGANAEKLVAKLKSQGHTSAKVLPPTGNNLHKVSSGDFSSSEEANNELKSVQVEFAGAWLYKK